MKVVHLLLAGASRFDRTCASIDAAFDPEVDSETYDLCPGADSKATVLSHGEIVERLRSHDISLVHMHGSTSPPAKLMTRLTVPWVSDRPLPLPRSFFLRIAPPSAVLATREVPEAVEDEWFIDATSRQEPAGVATVGTYVRSDQSRNRVEQAYGRIQRFRDDVTWTFFEEPPAPAELSALDLWVDPATGDDDHDGMVVEAIVCRTLVVASRTAPNTRRLDSGRAGVLTPSGDHNELTHAVLNALFKEEVRAPRLLHAAQIRDRFRPERRRAAVGAIYREIVR